MKKKYPVVHFEMPANDRKRMAEFYANVFGWETLMMGDEMGNYVVVTTADTDENGRPKNPGTINGGFFPRTDDNPNQHPSVVIAVDDIKEAIQKVKDSGGNVLNEPVEIPNIGWYTSFTDTENNLVSILQPAMQETAKK